MTRLPDPPSNRPHARVRPLPRRQVRLEDPFWSPRRQLLREVTLPALWKQLEAHHHLDNLRVLAGRKPGTHLGPVFLDSDLYKWLEAACYVLGTHPEEAALARQVEEVVGLVCDAQAKDGYLNSYHQLLAPEARFQALLTNHELYCAGHLMEAACAHHEATGRGELLEAARRFADLIVERFGPGRQKGIPGHQEVELALVRLYRLTGEKRYLAQADTFVRMRGRVNRYPWALLRTMRLQQRLAREANLKRAPYLVGAGEEETTSFGFDATLPFFKPKIFMPFFTGAYFQDHRPLAELTVAEGHAVRAMYYFAGAADVVLETGDTALRGALTTVWANTQHRRTYVTGGMGSLPYVEGFGADHELPNRSYAETCAAVGSFFYSDRMLQLSGEVCYADAQEQALYNAILSSLAEDGTRFFYQNPLISHGEHERKPWYVVACCPGNLCRLVWSLEQYLYGEDAQGLWIHHHVGGTVSFQVAGCRVGLKVVSRLPFAGEVSVEVVSLEEVGAGGAVKPMASQAFDLRMRIPGWARGVEARLIPVAGQVQALQAFSGTYLTVSRSFEVGDRVSLSLGMEAWLERSDPRVTENRGRSVLRRGPLVYCFDGAQNPGLKPLELTVDPRKGLKEVAWPALGEGAVAVEVQTVGGGKAVATPYFAWGNRGPGPMVVWVKTG